MIVGVAHIAIVHPDGQAIARLLSARGHDTVVLGDFAPVAEQEPFLRLASPSKVVLARGSGSTAVELISPQQRSLERSPCRILYRGDRPIGDHDRAIGDSMVDEVRAALATDAVPLELGSFHLPYYLAPADPPGGFAGLVVPTRHLAASASFWVQGLGFAVEREASSHLLLQFRSRLRGLSAQILLVDGRTTAAWCMDDVGATGVAVVASDLGAALTRLRESGAIGESRSFRRSVGPRSLAIAYVRGPGDELVELFQPVP